MPRIIGKVRTKEGRVYVEVGWVCAVFLIKVFFLSVWFPLSRGSGPAFDGSAARQASVAAAAERGSQR